MISYDPKNWFRVLVDFPRSPVFRTLFLDVIGAGLYAAFIVWVETDYFRVAVPLGPSFLSILGIILGLLLVFRTNTAYDRWWEGRKLWGQLVNISRGLSHALDAQLPYHDATRRSHYASLIASFPPALAAHLRIPRVTQRDEENNKRQPLPPTVHVPNEISRNMHRAVAEDIQAGMLSAESRISLQPLLTAFDDVTGACERIRNTPIPFSYSSYIKQFVLLYALVLPFGLVREFGYGTVIASMFTFFATMGLELLAGEIEEPFGTDQNDLPLDQLAERISLDVHFLLVPPASVPHSPTLSPS